MLKKFIGRGFLFILFLVGIGLIFTPTVKADDPNSTISKEMSFRFFCDQLENEVHVYNGITSFGETIEGFGGDFDLRKHFDTFTLSIQKGDWSFNTDTNEWEFKFDSNLMQEISVSDTIVNENSWSIDLEEAFGSDYDKSSGYMIRYSYHTLCNIPRVITTYTNGFKTTLIRSLDDPDCCPNFGRLAIEKTVTGGLGDKDKEFNFVVNFSKDNKIGYSYYRGDTYEGVIKSGDTVAIKDGERITIVGIPVDTTYEITEEEANEEGYTTTANGAIGTIVSGLTISSFENNKEDEIEEEEYGDLVIKKTVTGALGDKEKEFTFIVEFDDDGTFNYSGSKEGTITSGDKLTLKDGEEIKIEGLPVGTEYKVIEEEANKDGYKTIITGDEGLIILGTATASFENNKEDEIEEEEYGDLVIKKTVTGALGDKEKEFTFIVEFDDDGTFNYSGSKEGTITSGDKLTLKDGEEIKIEGLPVGTEYKVIEEEANKDGYKTIITGDEGLIILGTATASFENNKEDEIEEEEYGDLVIKKTVTGALGDKNKEFTFVVEFDNDGTYSYSGSKQGTITSGDKLTLKDGEEVRVEGLLVGTTYKVIEEEADKDGYKTTATDSEGIISEEESIVIYENNKEKAKTAAKELPKTGGMLMIALGGLSLFSGVTIIKSINKKK